METKTQKLPTPQRVMFDEITYNRYLSLLNNHYIPALEDMKKAFLKLDLGKLTEEYLHDIVFGDFELIKKELTEKVKSAKYDRFIVPAVVEKVNRMLSDLFYIRNKKLQSPAGVEFPMVWDYPSVDEDGNIILDEDAKERLKDQCSMFTITPRGIQLFEAHKKAAEALNEFYQFGKGNIADNLEGIFELNREGKIVPSIQDYDWYQYARATPGGKI